MTDETNTTEATEPTGTDPTVLAFNITTGQGDLDLSTADGHFHVAITPNGGGILDTVLVCLTPMELRTLQEMIKVALKASASTREEWARKVLVGKVANHLRSAPEDGNPFVFGADPSDYLGRPPRRRPDGDAPQGTYL